MIKEPHAYRDLNPEELEELFSMFLLDSWSYSKVTTFARNEADFERLYIYRDPSKMSAATIAGSAYHEALDKYFSVKQNKEESDMDIIDCQQVAYDYIDEVKATSWKLQKTTPSIEECKKKAIKVVNNLLEFFFGERSVYEDEIEEIIAVEMYFDEFLIVNGVDIPLPCHGKIDLVIRTKDDKIVIIDHKSKQIFSDEKELKFTMGKQAITYVNGYESMTGIEVDEVWFIEAKHTKNKSGAPQLNCFPIIIEPDTRKLYEALLYEALKKMLEAAGDPDYTYVINDNDNFIDKAELYEFKMRTYISDVEDFHVPENKKELISKRQKKVRDTSIAHVDPKIIKKFKENASEFIQYNLTNKNMTPEEKIEHTMKTLGIQIRVAHKFEGYSSDTYLIEVSAGNNISKMHNYKLDIANALNVSSIRMMKNLKVHEGQSYLAVESSKKNQSILPYDPKQLVEMKIPIGLDNFKKPIIWDLNNQSTPHALVCGATGSGKSVLIKCIIAYAKLAGVKNIFVLDPKFEFANMNSEEGVNVYNEIEEIEKLMKDMVFTMNDMVRNGTVRKTLIIFDEFGDALSQSRKGKELDIYEKVVVGVNKKNEEVYAKEKVGTDKPLEENLKILLQKGRSSGFRIVAATQRASTKVITGDAKVNFPVQICFRVPKEVDSKVVLDESGAESLSGKGDGLMNSPEYNGLVRFQGFFKE